MPPPRPSPVNRRARQQSRRPGWLIPAVILAFVVIGIVAVMTLGPAKPAAPPTVPPAEPVATPTVATPVKTPVVEAPPPPPPPPPAPTAVQANGSVSFTVELAKTQYVTVVIDDASGKRVRNLLSETRLPAGKNVLTWDGYDDGTKKDGDLVQKRVEPGAYRVRGLTHDGIKTIFEFPLYAGGQVPWANKDQTGAWLADHSSTLGATFIPSGGPYGDGKPQILLTALVAETGRATVWVDTDGKVIQRRAMWGWNGGQAAATDLGKDHDKRYYAFVLGSFGEDGGVFLNALAVDGTTGPAVAEYKPKVKMEREPRVVGLTLAVRDGLAVASVPLDDAVVFFDVKQHKVLGTAAVKAPKGVLLDDQGRLLVSTAGTVKRFKVTRPADGGTPTLDAGTVLISGLTDPRNIATDPQGKELYVADWGKLNQIKVFTAAGKAVRTIGKPGGYQIGAYDEQRMHLPQGMAVDDKGQLWVAEADWIPKRVSVWNTANGAFKRAYYGPPHYGGGGTIDPQDPTRCFYGEYGGTMEFKLDWEKGTSTLVAIPIRTWDVPKTFDEMSGHTYGAYGPEVPFRLGGRLYLTLGFQGGHRTNEAAAFWLYDDKTHTARPVAHVGSMRYWEFARMAPWMKELTAKAGSFEPFLAWTDLNADGKVTPEEFQVRPFAETVLWGNGERKPLHGFREFYPNPDLALSGSYNLQVPPPTVRADGTLMYDISKAVFVMPPRQEDFWGEDSTGGIKLADGTWLKGFTGWRDGRKMWEYPVANDQGLPPQFPGQVTEPTRLMSYPFTPKAGDAKNISCWNGERGNMFLLTGDGLYIQTIAGHRATAELFSHFPEAKRGMDVSGYSFEDEHFHPTLTCTKDGIVYMVAGKEHSSIFRLDGWESIQARQFGEVALAPEAVAKMPPTKVTPGRKQGKLNGTITLLSSPPAIDGKLDDWPSDGWLDIASAGKGRLAIANGRLYAAWRTTNPQVLANTAADPEFAFKRGGAVDLMVGPENRWGEEGFTNALNPIVGDQRVLFCQTNGKNLAVIYRQVAMKRRLGKPQLYDSPVGKVQFGDVAVVTDQVELAQVDGNVEASVPLNLLELPHFNGSSGQKLIGDMGILRGEGAQTTLRSYWNNLYTAMVSDIPTEARLVPANWGILEVKAGGPGK